MYLLVPTNQRVTKHCKMTGLGMRSASATLQFIWCALAIENVKHGKAIVHFVLPKHSQGGNCLGVNKTGKMSVNVFGVMHGFRLLCTPLCMFALQKCMQLVQRMLKCLLRCCLALSCVPDLGRESLTAEPSAEQSIAAAFTQIQLQSHKCTEHGSDCHLLVLCGLIVTFFV